jgi:hypothetical protein
MAVGWLYAQVKGADLVKKLGAVVAFDIEGTVGWRPPIWSSRNIYPHHNH